MDGGGEAVAPTTVTVPPARAPPRAPPASPATGPARPSAPSPGRTWASPAPRPGPARSAVPAVRRRLGGRAPGPSRLRRLRGLEAIGVAASSSRCGRRSSARPAPRTTWRPTRRRTARRGPRSACRAAPAWSRASDRHWSPPPTRARCSRSRPTAAAPGRDRPGGHGCRSRRLRQRHQRRPLGLATMLYGADYRPESLAVTGDLVDWTITPLGDIVGTDATSYLARSSARTASWSPPPPRASLPPPPSPPSAPPAAAEALWWRPAGAMGPRRGPPLRSPP